MASLARHESQYMRREGDSDSDLDRKVVFELGITKGNISTRLLDS